MGSPFLQWRRITSYCCWCFLLWWTQQHEDYCASAFTTSTLGTRQWYHCKQKGQWTIFAEWNKDEEDSAERGMEQQYGGTEPMTTGLFYTLPRLYVGSTTTTSSMLGPGTTIPLSPQQSHYVTKVMRMGSTKNKKKQHGNNNNNQVRLFDGHSGEWLAELSIDEPSASADSASKKPKQRQHGSTIVMATCIQQLRPQPNIMDEPWLFVAPLKKPRTKLLLEKCTELGVGRVVWIQTDRTDAKNVATCITSHDKLSIQLVEASEQCERLTIPTLISNNIMDNVSNNNEENSSQTKKEELWNVETLLKHWISDHDSTKNNHPGTLLVCRERSNTSLPILTALQTCAKGGGIAFLIGPEGGWSPNEEEMFDKYSSDRIQCVSLGSLVLRAETAAMTAVASYMLHKDSLI